MQEPFEAALVSLIAIINDPASKKVDVNDGVTVEVYLRGSEYSGREYARLFFEVRISEQPKRLTTSSLIALESTLFSFTADLRQEITVIIDRLRDFVRRQSESIISEQTENRLTFPSIREEKRTIPYLIGVIVSVGLATMVLVRLKSGISSSEIALWAMALLSLFLSIGGLLGAKVTWLFPERIVRLRYYFKIREHVLDFLSPWKGKGFRRLVLRKVQPLVESSSDRDVRIKDILKLAGLEALPSEPRPQEFYVFGLGLGKIAELLSDHPERRNIYRQALRECGANKEDDDEFLHYLVAVADNFDLPAWAVECFPSLFRKIELRDAQKCVMLMWRPIFNYLETRNWIDRWHITRPLCRGVVMEVEADVDCYGYLKNEAAGLFESLRSRLPFGSDGAMKGAILDALTLLEERDSKNGLVGEASRIADLKRQISDAEGIGYSANAAEDVDEVGVGI
jgi:hypothetical protein